MFSLLGVYVLLLCLDVDNTSITHNSPWTVGVLKVKLKVQIADVSR